MQFTGVAGLLQALQRLFWLAHRGVQRGLLAQRQITDSECLGEVLTRAVPVAEALAQLPALCEQGGIVAVERQRFGGGRARFGILPLGDQGADQQFPIRHLFREATHCVTRFADRSFVVTARQCLVASGSLVDRHLFLNRLPTASQHGLRADCLLGIVDRYLRFVQTLLTLQCLNQHHAVIEIRWGLCDGFARMVSRTVVITFGISAQRLIAFYITRLYACLREALRVVATVFVVLGQGNQVAQLLGIAPLAQRFARLGDGEVVVLAVVGHVGLVGDGIRRTGQRQRQCFCLTERRNKAQAAHQQRQDEGALHSGCSV
ncbi:hypothetical protein KPSA1_06045 [Pseudomonas syringae pv. actinidiae]|uniref:Uncharacterized protein n=1 Tax=Pseudomonas syringae pv. actinidiae TaxID=103796 RepID=A0A2V0QHG6_PSESF|nr:hypothetical protein KPSA1_06045 [Pseudomonas syringae pv. actinidiae]